MFDIQGRKYAAITVCDVTLYDLTTKYPVMYFDTLQMTNIEGASETTDIQGGQGNAVLASVSHSKTVDVQFDDAIMTMSSLALLTGGDIERGKSGNLITMTETELVTVAGGATSLTLSKTAKAGSYVWISKMEGSVLSTATRTENKLEAASTTIDFADFHNPGLAPVEETNYRVFYEHEVALAEGESTVITILADKFAGSYRFVGETVLFNTATGSNDTFQVEIPRLKLDSSYSLNFTAATEGMVFSFKGKALKDELGRMIVFRSLKADAAAATDDSNVQLDGAYRSIPAKRVAIAEDGTIEDLDPITA